jgi:alkaline phosphatase D
MGVTALPMEAANWIGPDASAETRGWMANDLAASKAGLPYYLDSWDGYPAARRRLLEAALAADANLVVLTGDSHNAWGFELDSGGTPAGVEFVGSSVTSPGLETDWLKVPSGDVVRAFRDRNPQLKWAELSRRGYATLELTPGRATGEWLFLQTIRNRSTRLAATHRMSAAFGARRFTT